MPSRTATPKQSPAPSNAHDVARDIGIDEADAWLNRRLDDAIVPASSVAWRATCYADAVHAYESRPDFLQILAAWESGFDSTMAVSKRQRSAQSHIDTIKRLSVDQLFHAAFSINRDPRSPEYKAGVRAALAFRIEGKRIAKLYDPASAQDDAYYSGITEGHALWRAAAAEIGGAA